MTTSEAEALSKRPSAPGPEAERKLVLASTSAYRVELLARLGVPFQARAPRCDEAALQRREARLGPRLLAEKLAQSKALSVADEFPGAAVIGCDQLVAFEGRIFGKPGSAERSAAQLLAMSGQTHELITALVVAHQGDWFRHTDIARLRMRPLSREAIERYVAADRPFDCAGGYKLEARGIVLFDRIESADNSAITGLPLIALVTILRALGFVVP